MGASLKCLLNCTPEAGGVRLGDVESGVAEAGEVGIEREAAGATEASAASCFRPFQKADSAANQFGLLGAENK